MYGVTETRAYMVSLDGSSCFIVYFIHKKAYWFLILKRYMISLNKRKNTNNKNQHSWIYSSIVLILLPYIYVSCSMGVLVHALIIQNKFHTIENVVIFPIRIFHYKTLKKYIIRFDEISNDSVCYNIALIFFHRSRQINTESKKNDFRITFSLR